MLYPMLLKLKCLSPAPVELWSFHSHLSGLEMCVQYFVDHPTVIGSPGVEVEIDESKFGRRKYHHGRYVEGHWLFWGTE